MHASRDGCNALYALSVVRVESNIGGSISDKFNAVFYGRDSRSRARRSRQERGYKCSRESPYSGSNARAHARVNLKREPSSRFLARRLYVPKHGARRN